MARDLVIGLDFATSAGFAVFDISGNLVERGNWYAKNEASGFAGDRWIAYELALGELLKRYRGRVLVVGYERPPVYSKIQYNTIRVLFGQAAIAEAVCARHALETQEIPPATIKKVVAGNGRATKDEVLDAVERKTGAIHATGNGRYDQADSTGVCLVILDRMAA